MRVVFVCSEDESLGIGYLSSYLKKFGHETFLVFDPRQFDRAYAQNHLLAKIFSLKKYNAKKVALLQPDLVCFSVLTANYQWALSMAKLIKEEINVPIIFGGIHPTSLPEEVLKNSQIDMVCIGEGELALKELVENIHNKNTCIKNIWFKKDDKVIKNKIRPLITDLDSLPFPDKEMFYKQLPASYRKNPSIATSRGCFFNCSYCCNDIYHKLYRPQVFLRQRSVENVIEELMKMKKVFKSEHIFFVDDLFAFNKKWLRSFSFEYARKIKLPFSCLSHPKFIDKETTGLLKKCGCRILMLGVQTGNDYLRRNVFMRSETNDDILRAAESCRTAGLKFSVDHILNAPGDSDRIELESAELYNRIRPNMVNCYGLLYFPSTEIAKIARSRGFLGKRAEKLINEGKMSLYPSLILTTKGRNLQGYYQKYTLLLTLIPLFPEIIMTKIIRSSLLRKIISFFPLSSVLLIKIVLNFGVGMGLLPLSILKNEIYFLKNFLRVSFSGKE